MSGLQCRLTGRAARAHIGLIKTIAFFFLFFLALAGAARGADGLADRFVWVFGWNLENDGDVPEIIRVLDAAGQHGCNGAVLSAGLDSLSEKSPAYFRRLEEIQRACERDHLELIPSYFSIGYGGGFLSHNPNLAEGLLVEDAPMTVKNGQAWLEDRQSSSMANGGFEEYSGNQFKGYNFHDQPGEISFVDTSVKHSGRASLRMQNFTANPYGHGRVMQEVRVQPRRCYRLKLWVKTENLQPANTFRMMALADQDRDLAPREFRVPATGDWQEISMIFNSLDAEKVRLYAGVWGAKSGAFWLDDWSLEEAGPVNVLHRPGTPVRVRGEDGAATFQEGADYAPLGNARPHVWRDTDDPAPLKILPAGRIHEGDHLRVSWYHSMLINDSQVAVCMAEPEIYDIFEQETKLLAQRLHPRRVLLGIDEVRMGGTCRACEGRNLGELLGQCATRQADILRRYLPGVRIYAWSDMFDPNHNAHGHYYLARGDFTGSWQHVPKDFVMAVWGGAPRPESVKFFADQGFPMLLSCYYDADNLNEVQGWLKLARSTPGVRGLMYTPWEKKYTLLPAFGDLLSK
ncbi:MAG TPA: hypothetical protein VGO59_07110 [Verrucomicrobiae bacterium]|jgi:hypothetical protein